MTSTPLLYADANSTTGLRVDRLSNFAIAVAVFLGGFVIFEPAPYEVMLAALLAIFFLFGMRIQKEIFPLLILVTTFTTGGIISSFMIEDHQRGLIYNAVTLFLGLTSVFFAVVIKQDMNRIRLILRAYVIAAVATSILGILGFFSISGFELFTKYDRARGAFADPNVFAPFLVAPILYLVYGTLRRSATLLPIRLSLLGIMLLGLLLAGSRAGWALTVLAIGMFYFLLLINEPSPQRRVTYILMGFAGAVSIVIAVIAALQMDSIWEIINQRARVVQDYDGARIGRFARHAIGFELALSKPFGIGNLEFGFLYGEDEHNVYLRSLLSYGWLGFISWSAMVFWPLIAGFKLLFARRPWQVYFQIAYISFFGHLLIGWVIDIDHWRHFYLLLGVIWGCILLEKQWQCERHTHILSQRYMA